jgi:hypothetical protein
VAASHVQVSPDSTGKDVDADALTSTEGGTPTVYRQDMVVADPVTYANKARVFAPGHQRVTMDPVQLFLDSFDLSLDTTAKWVTPVAAGTGAIAAAWSSGQVLLSGGTVLNAYSELHSQPAFAPEEPGFLLVTFRNNIEFPVLTTAYRFWGVGQTTGTPTIAAPLTEAVGWEVSTGGVFAAVTYGGGTRLQIATVTAPGNNAAHKYYLYFRGDLSYWAFDDPDNVVASYPTGASGPNVNSLPLKALVISNSGTLATLQVNGVSVGDTGRNGVQLSDGVNAWRKARVGISGALGIMGGSPATVATSVPVATPTTIGPLSVAEAGNVTFVVKNTTAGSAWTGAPVFVFEQSDDNVSWGPLNVTRADTFGTGSTFTLGAGTANASLMLDAGVEGVGWVRCRCTTAPTGNALTVVIVPGGLDVEPSVASIAPPPSAGAKTSVAAAVASTTLLAANPLRKQAIFMNDSTANLFLDLTGGTASTTSYSAKILAGGYYEIPWPVYTGLVTGTWDVAAGNARVTEMT